MIPLPPIRSSFDMLVAADYVAERGNELLAGAMRHFALHVELDVPGWLIGPWSGSGAGAGSRSQ